MPSEDSGRRDLWLPVLAVIAVAIKLWLVQAQDLTAIPSSLHDDQLLLDRALSLLSGDWLGPYNERTLIKGPFYSFWIAATFLAGIPLLAAQQLLYAAACGLLATSLRPLFNSRWPALLLFLALLFSPASFDSAMTRVYRNGVDPALVLLVTACAFGILVRASRGPRSSWPWACGLGLSMAAFWLNREEALWILPLVSLAVLGAVALAPRNSSRLAILGVVVLLPVLIWQGILAGMSLANLGKYGHYGVVEIKSPEFEAAWGALSRAGAADFEPYVPLPRSVREQLYRLSPAFSELRPVLDGPSPQHRQSPGCRWVGVCDDHVGGWVLWAFRRAVARAGHHRSASAAADYYERLATEVNAACDQGKLDCARPRSTLVPVLRWDYAQPWARRLLIAAVKLVRFEGISVSSSWARGSDRDRAPFETLTGEGLAQGPDLERLRQLEGWAFSSKSKPRFVVLKPGGSKAKSYIKFRRSPAIRRALGPSAPPQAERARFILRTNCSSACILQVYVGHELITQFRFDEAPARIETRDFFFAVDEHPSALAARLASALDSSKLSVLEWISRTFGRIAPLIAILAFLVYLAKTARIVMTRRLEPRWLLATAILASLGVFLALLSLIDLTSFGALHPLYLGPAYPLVLVFPFLMGRSGRRPNSAVISRAVSDAE